MYKNEQNESKLAQPMCIRTCNPISAAHPFTCGLTTQTQHPNDQVPDNLESASRTETQALKVHAEKHESHHKPLRKHVRQGGHRETKKEHSTNKQTL